MKRVLRYECNGPDSENNAKRRLDRANSTPGSIPRALR